MTNYWMCRMDPPLAQWECCFDNTSRAVTLSQLIEFSRRLILAGTKLDVYSILEVPGPFAFKLSPEHAYPDHLMRIAETTSKLPFFDLGFGVAKTPAGILRTPGRVCYYDSDNILIERPVENLGVLLRQLRPDDVDWGEGFMMQVAPVSISGQTHILEDNQLPLQKIRIFISLCTDIWFTKVLGFLEDDFNIRGNGKWFSNTVLATCHTPRLNEFLSSVRKDTIDLGGNWHLVPAKGSATHYAGMINESGVIL